MTMGLVISGNMLFRNAESYKDHLITFAVKEVQDNDYSLEETSDQLAFKAAFFNLSH